MFRDLHLFVKVVYHIVLQCYTQMLKKKKHKKKHKLMKSKRCVVVYLICSYTCLLLNSGVSERMRKYFYQFTYLLWMKGLKKTDCSFVL